MNEMNERDLERTLSYMREQGCTFDAAVERVQEDKNAVVAGMAAGMPYEEAKGIADSRLGSGRLDG